MGQYSAVFGLALAITSLLNALLVVLKEQNNETVLAWMTAATGHHWISHGMLVIVLFIVLRWLMARLGLGADLTGNRLSALVSGSLALSGLVIAGYFI
ncbi:hypothetical protein [Marinobacterium aestuariivivens]|uniref:Uncharacterized protein n=1 Tax=Marinobacterium aestuariivivens TaxID=1698799 RepID=A0ABW2A8L7_9GAMM